MMRSLYSGVSGLKVHQTKMDVIGNNIANVNTVGFKSSSVTFSEVFYQTTQVASGPNAETGTAGRNAKQIGLGTSIGSINTNITTEGGSQRTDNPFDLKISGDSFFVVNNAGNNYFTKAGNFTTDANGNLVTASGAYVMGYTAQKPGDALQTDKLRPLAVYGSQYSYTTPEATTASTVTGNINAEDSNFTEGKPITMSVSFYDSLGNLYSAQVNIEKDATTDGQYNLSVGDVTLGSDVVDLDSTPTLSATSLTFDPATGVLTSPTEPITLTISGKESLAEPISIDFSDVTSYGSETTIEAARGDADGNNTGKAVGNMTGVGIQADGKIVASYDNGDNEVIGQIAVAVFDNPAGLEKVGDNMFAATLNSGDFNGIGEDITASGGSISTGVLEMSNVDLSSEFTEMITTQRGFQANSRVITTSDSMLEELLNLKR